MNSKENLHFLEQDIEIDAIAFAHYMTDKLFHHKSYIPDSIKLKVLDSVDKLKISYDDKLDHLL